MTNFTTNPHGVFGRHVQRDGLADGEHGEPVKTVDFDYGEVDRSLGFSEPRVDNGTGFEDAGEALCEICRWIADSRTRASAGQKALAMAWVIKPELFENIRTASGLSKRYRMYYKKFIASITEFHWICGGRVKFRTVRGSKYRSTLSNAIRKLRASEKETPRHS